MFQKIQEVKKITKILCNDSVPQMEKSVFHHVFTEFMPFCGFPIVFYAYMKFQTILYCFLIIYAFACKLEI